MFGFHQVHEDVVDAGDVAFAFRPEPLQHARIEAHAYRHFAAHVADAHHAGQLFGRELRDIGVIDAPVVARSLPGGNALDSFDLAFSPLPVPDIFRCHSYQPLAR